MTNEELQKTLEYLGVSKDKVSADIIDSILTSYFEEQLATGGIVTLENKIIGE